MIQITEITLKNFQSHGYTKINLENGLNAIVGKTDSGKTAIFRALKWVLYNEPQGDFFIKNGENSVSVELKLNSGYSVRRYKNKSSNGYEITSPEGETSTFEGIGRSVPEEVINITGIKKINFTQNEGNYINLQQQLDPPFLISESPSYRAKAIGKLVGADVIDLAISDANADLRIKKRIQKETETKIENLESQLEEFGYLGDLKNKLEALNDLNLKIKLKEERLDNLKSAYENFENIKNSKDKAEFILESFKNLEDVDEKIYSLQKYTNKLEKIYNIIDRRREVLNRKKSTEKIVNALKNIQYVQKNFEQLSDLQKKLQELKFIDKNLKTTEVRKSTQSEILGELGGIEKVSAFYETLNLKINILQKLSYEYQKQSFLQNKIKAGDIYVGKFKNIYKSENISRDLEEKIVRNKRLNELKKSLSDSEKSINIQKNTIKKAKAEIVSKSKIYKDILLKSGVCPTCYRKIDEHDAQTILYHIEG